MPVALYAISHKDTRRVLAFASLEKRTTLTDTKAWEAFRTELLGQELSLPKFGTHGKLLVPTPDLAVDEIQTEGLDQNDFYDDPYGYEIGKPATGASAPGDGTPKKLTTPGNVATPTLAAASGTLTVTLANPPTEPLTVTVVFEGEGPKSNTIVAPNLTATFHVDTALTAAQRYLVVVLCTGAPVVAGLVEAT